MEAIVDAKKKMNMMKMGDVFAGILHENYRTFAWMKINIRL